MQLILDESAEVLRVGRGVLIVRTRHGLVCANAGIDQSNVPDDAVACLLPADPDASARALRGALAERLGVAPGRGRLRQLRPRRGASARLDVAIGCAGLAPLARPARRARRARAGADRHDRRGRRRRPPSAAALVRHKAGREAVVMVHGLERYVTPDDGPGAAAIVRPARRGPLPPSAEPTARALRCRAPRRPSCRASASLRASSGNTSTSVRTGTSRRQLEEVAAVRARQVRDAAQDALAPQQVVIELGIGDMWIPAHTTTPPLRTARSASGTSAPAGAKMITLSSSTGGVVVRRRPRPPRARARARLPVSPRV